MKVLREGIPNTITCQSCGSLLEYNYKDIKWTHTETDYYYVTCPVCSETLWIKSNKELDEMYKRHINELK